jgi:hypoxanthine phosphoribosyltransferase
MSDQEEIFYYTPELFYADGQILLEQISGHSFDIVLAIANGGVPLGTFLAKSLSIPMHTIKIKSYCGHEQHTLEICNEPKWYELKDLSILVVDDLIDNGKTLICLKELLQTHSIQNYKIAVLIDKKKNPALVPDYFVRIQREWIVFFWEPEYYNKSKKSGGFHY